MQQRCCVLGQGTKARCAPVHSLQRRAGACMRKHRWRWLRRWQRGSSAAPFKGSAGRRKEKESAEYRSTSGSAHNALQLIREVPQDAAGSRNDSSQSSDSEKKRQHCERGASAPHGAASGGRRRQQPLSQHSYTSMTGRWYLPYTWV